MQSIKFNIKWLEIAEVKIMNNIQSNKRLGMKWFTFYTKVRPWIACLVGLTTISDFVKYTDVYLSTLWLLISFLAALLQPILSIIVFSKSSGNYIDFVHFVKGVLLFETINLAYQQGVKQYIYYDFELGIAMITFFIALVVGFFVWYILNVKYFEKRISQMVPDYFVYGPDHITECKFCGYRDRKHFNACPKCGMYAKHNVYLSSEVSCEKNKVRFCRKCGEKIVENGNYCLRCGTEIVKE